MRKTTIGKRGERKVARRTGGRRQPGSGSGRRSSAKADVRKQNEWRIEVKTTKSDSFRVTASMLDKLQMQTCWPEIPVLAVNLPGLTVYLVPWQKGHVLEGRKSVKIDEAIVGQYDGIRLSECRYHPTWKFVLNLEDM